jgi:hypothetical protein
VDLVVDGHIKADQAHREVPICGSGMPPTCVSSGGFFDAVLLHGAHPVVCLRMNCFIRSIAGAA